MLGLSLGRGAPMPDVRIQGQRTMLRAPTERDWEQWARLRQASRAFLAPWEPTWAADALTRETYRRRLRRYGENWRDDKGYALFIFSLPSQDLVGGVTLSNVRRGVVQSGSLGYWIGRPYARSGLMTDSLKALLPFCFEQIGLHRIEAACLPHNEPSRRVLERVGFTREGYARKYLCIDGRWQDHLLFAILREDLRGPRPPAH